MRRIVRSSKSPTHCESGVNCRACCYNHYNDIQSIFSSTKYISHWIGSHCLAHPQGFISSQSIADLVAIGQFVTKTIYLSFQLLSILPLMLH